MAVITQQQLEDAARDADDLGAIINGAADRPNPGHPNGTVTTRTGGDVPTVAKLFADFNDDAQDVLESVQASLDIDGYLLLPAGIAAWSRIKYVKLQGADPAKFYQIKQFYYHDVGNRALFQISQSTDAAGTGETIVCQFTDGGSGFTQTGRKQVALAAVGGSGITGMMVIDFDDGNTPWAVYDAATSYATAGLPPGVAVPNIDVSAQIEAALAVEVVREGRQTFQPYVRNDWLEDRILAIGIEGADPGHQYIISQAWFEYYPTAGPGGTPLYRWKVRVRDTTLGIDCCEYGGSSPTNPSLTPGMLPEWGYMTYYTITSGFTGVTGMVKINWALVDWTIATQNNYTLPSESGVALRNCYTNDQMDSFLIESDPALVLTVGEDGDFATVTEAIESLYKFGLVPNNQSTPLPWSDLCSYTRQVLIQILDDDHHEDLNELLMPPYITIRGKGIDNTIFSHTSPDTTERLLEFRHSGCIEDCTLIQSGPAYVIHADAFNDLGGVAANGPAIQRFRNRKVLRRVKLVCDQQTGNAWGWGSGISSWEYALFEDCIFSKTSLLTPAILGIHTTPGMSRGATVHLRRCQADSFHNTEVVLISGFEQTQLNRCIVEGGNIKLVSMGSSFGNTAADMPVKARMRAAWEGFGDGTFLLNDPLMDVLQLPPGATVSGTAANALVGAGYDQKHGRGENLIMEENPYRKLGAILGNCTGGNTKTLTVNGVTHTFNLDYTGMTEAAILASIAAGPLGADVVSVVNLAQFIVPPGQQRFMQAGAALEAKRFVNYVADKAQLANGRPDGFTFEKMANNGTDIIYEERVFAGTMIPELVNYDGEFKIVNGVATATSAGDPLSVGEVYNGVAVLYD